MGGSRLIPAPTLPRNRVGAAVPPGSALLKGQKVMDLESLEKIEQELRADWGHGLNDRAADAIAWARNEIDRHKTLAMQAVNALRSSNNLAERVMAERNEAWDQIERNREYANAIKAMTERMKRLLGEI